MKVSKSGFYKWKNQMTKTNDIKLESEIQKVYESSRGTYGFRRIVNTLKKSFISIGKKRVIKIMKRLNIRGIGKPKFKVTTKISKSSNHCPDLIQGDFIANKPNQLWTSDITYIPTKEGWVYLNIILDTFSRKIIGWSMKDTMQKEIIIDSLNMAYSNRNGFEKGIIFHSDRGSQYSCKEVKKYLKSNGFHQSMSYSCYDNSITETFFATLKKELVHRCHFLTRSAAKSSIFEFIEVFYNRLRSHSALDYLSPLEYEENYVK